MVGTLPAGAVALHWNEDGFETPEGAVELLARPAGTSEAFRYGECAWGVQFHPEVDPAGLEGWYRSGLAELARPGSARRRPAPPTRAPSGPAGALHRALRRLRPRGRRPLRHRVTYPHWLSIPTRWQDNDVYGHVNNVEYYAFFDTVINEYLISAGGLDIVLGR